MANAAGFDLLSHTHLLVVGGSRAYGLHRPSSDVDLKGMVVAPRTTYLGILEPFAHADAPEQIAAYTELLSSEEQDIVQETKLEGIVYALPKLVRLAADANPHMLDVLFCRDAEVRQVTTVGERLRAAGPSFLSKRARHSFGGYAAAQLKRIENHRRWLLSPPDHKPTRADFGLPEQSTIAKDQLQAVTAAVRKQVDSWELDLSGVSASTGVEIRNRIAQVLAEIEVGHDEKWVAAARHVGLDDNFIWVLQQERRYRRARQEFRQYQHWKQSRNPERAALEAAHGYDTKHAAHLVRLLSMAEEILDTACVHVWRGDRDAEQLQDIRAGRWTYDALIDWTQQAETRIAAAAARSSLPERADRDVLNALVIELTEEAFSLRG